MDILRTLVKLSFRYGVNVFHKMRYSDLVMPPLRVLVMSPVDLTELVPHGELVNYGLYFYVLC